MGEMLHLPIALAARLARGARAAARQPGSTVVALTPAAGSIDIDRWARPDGPLAIMLGAEGPGLSAAALDAADVRRADPDRRRRGFTERRPCRGDRFRHAPLTPARRLELGPRDAIRRTDGDLDQLVALLDRHGRTGQHGDDAPVVVEIDLHARLVSLNAERDVGERTRQVGREVSAAPVSNIPAKPNTTVPHTPPADAMCTPSAVFLWVSARSTNSAWRK